MPYLQLPSLGIPLNTTKNDGQFFIAKDESFIVLGRNESNTNRDLYISYKKSDGTWCTPRSLGSKINNGQVFKMGPLCNSGIISICFMNLRQLHGKPGG